MWQRSLRMRIVTAMNDREINGAVRRGVKTAVGILILLAVWQAAARTGIWSAYVLPPPAKVAKALAGMVESGVLFRHIGVSFRRVLEGFSIADRKSVV